MLENELYSIIGIEQTGENNLVAEIGVNPGHPVFDGHFPGSPVMPGVIQLQWVKAILERKLDREVRLKTLRTCKFLEVLNPDETPVVHVHIKYKEEENLEVVASGEYSGKVFFKVQAAYLIIPTYSTDI